MGQDKTSTAQTTSQQTQYTPTAEETELNRLALERAQATQSGQITAQTQGLNLINQLLSGGQLPGYLNQLTTGISPEAISTQASLYATKAQPGFQSMGLGDSGVAYRETARGIANEVLLPAQQFNIQNLQQLLNQALGGQAQVQAPIQAGTNTLASSLAGLRSINQTGTGTSTTSAMNPFLKSFQTSLGSTLGSPSFVTGGGFKGITF